MNNYSKYIIDTVSFDGKYGLLYNLKNEYFLRYALCDFYDKNELLKNEEICNFLEEKDFFESKDENEFILNKHRKEVSSKNKLMLILKITKGCNFQCIYCYENDNRITMNEKTMQSLLLFIEKSFRRGEYKELGIGWFGGEPLVNYSFIERCAPKFIQLCKKYNVKYTSCIVTNGYLLNSDKCQKLVDLGVNLFQITIDGPSYIHNKQRPLRNGKSTYNTILDNLNCLSKIKGDFIVLLRTNVSKTMLGNMDSYFVDIKKFFDDPRFFAQFHTVVDFKSMDHEITDLQILEEVKNAIDHGIRFLSLKQYLSPTKFYCYGSLDNHYVVETDLKISKCTEVNEKYSYVGRIAEDGDIVFNDNRLLWKLAKYSDKCVSCSDFVSCDGGVCPLYYLKNGDSRCMNFKHDKEYLVKIAELQKSYNMTLHY